MPHFYDDEIRISAD